MLESGNDFLDVGCGDGTFCSLAKKTYAHVVGIDISEVAIELAKKKFDIDAKIMDLNTRLDFKDDEFDTISCLDVIEHVFDPHHLVAEISRILRKNGLLILSVPNIQFFPHIIKIIRGRFPKTSDDPGYDGGHLHYFTVKDVKILLQEHNLITKFVLGLNGRKHLISFISPSIFIKAYNNK
ncbi:MAG: class I SAM-dependent methyltransferase [Candidatus Sigynarchaeota archaeon]